MKRRILIFGIIFISLITVFDAVAQRNGRLTKVVIDAGHGGKDPGAIGKYSKEKDIALAIALKTGAYIEKEFKDVEVIYTRKTDRFVELYKRAEIANKANADLFISIHCNANDNKRVHGAATYVMGLHKNNANLAVAKKENAAILKENNLDKYQGFDPNDADANIIFSLYQSAYLNESLEFASIIQKQFKNRLGLKDNGVRQAGFWVLYKTAMPGVLIETAFISNPKEEKFLRSKKNQTYIASAIYRAFKQYKHKVDKDYSNQLKLSKIHKNPDIEFRVQFASYKKSKSKNYRKFKGIKNVVEYYHNGMYKYTSGHLKTYSDAVKYQKNLKKKGFKDTFIVAFNKGKRISVKKALDLIEKIN
ncbi:MAG: N-acetylmuramoyl-L-alanine amidase [Bacteroidales bacterium]|nr:N-acetylmuramoyl-L-alanine amidase [Bacteroidales bacterium]